MKSNNTFLSSYIYPSIYYCPSVPRVNRMWHKYNKMENQVRTITAWISRTVMRYKIMILHGLFASICRRTLYNTKTKLNPLKLCIINPPKKQYKVYTVQCTYKIKTLKCFRGKRLYLHDSNAKFRFYQMRFLYWYYTHSLSCCYLKRCTIGLYLHGNNNYAHVKMWNWGETEQEAASFPWSWWNTWG